MRTGPEVGGHTSSKSETRDVDERRIRVLEGIVRRDKGTRCSLIVDVCLLQEVAAHWRASGHTVRGFPWEIIPIIIPRQPLKRWEITS